MMSSSSWETTLCLVRQPVVGSGSRRGRILVPFPWIDSVITGRSEIVTPTIVATLVGAPMRRRGSWPPATEPPSDSIG